jgi:hypothetical protein
MTVTRPERDSNGGAESPQTTPLLAPEEIQTREAEAAATLPARDREAVERSAGEGMVGTPIEAAATSTRRLSGPAELETADGLPVGTVVVDLHVIRPTWSGTLMTPQDDPGIETGRRYRLRLPDGQILAMTITNRASDIYTIEGIDPFDADA